MAHRSLPTLNAPLPPSSSSASPSSNLAPSTGTQRPQLSLSTPLNNSSQPLSPPNNTASLSSENLKDVSLSTGRAHSHGRSHSMSEHQFTGFSNAGTNYSSQTAGGSGGFGFSSSSFNSGYPMNNESNFSSGGSSMGDSVISTGTTVSGAQLARRNNTVGASNSRLVRLERNRARIALQGAGLSEEDQEFYVPPSPARTGPFANVPWSDVGHGTIDDVESPFNSLVSPTGSTFDRHSRSFSNQSDVVAAAAWARAGSPQGQQQQQQYQNQQQQSIAPEPKRSSFVVLRGGKGDSKLTERRPANAISPPPTDFSTTSTSVSPNPQSQTQAIDISGNSSGSTQLRHKNSLKPFLDQEREEREQGGRAEEDWERGLMDERKSGAEGGAEGEIDDTHSWLQSDPYATLKTPPLSSSFPSQLSSPFGNSHSRSSTFHAPARNQTDPWSSSGSSGANAFEEDSSIRRHQSLTSFRSREPTETQVLSTSPGSASNETHEQLERAHSLSHAHQSTDSTSRPLGSLALNSTSTAIAGFGSRSRSGTSPAPLNLHHSHSLGHASSSQRAGLSHSNSLGSKKSNMSLGGGGGGGGGSLSPSLGVAISGLKSPWSPTEEETKQLGMGTIGTAAPGGGGGGGSVSPNGSGTLSRGGSGSSRGSQQLPSSTTTQALGGGFDEQVNRLGDQLGGMQMNYHLETPTASQQQFNSSPSRHQPPVANSSASSRRLPPLMTTPEALSPNLQQGFLPRQGPASASAFVPPIGHSHHGFVRGGAMGDISEHPSIVPSSFVEPQEYSSIVPNGANQQLLPPQSMYGTPAALPPTNSVPLSSFSSQLHPQHASAFPGGPSSTEWSRQKEFLMGGVANNPGPLSASTIVPSASLPFSSTGNPTLPPQSSVSPADWNLMQQQQAQISLLQSQMAQALKAMDAITAQTGQQQLADRLREASADRAVEEVAETPIDVNSLVQKKGYNPSVFDLRPQNARFFVIKSYTEEDVHKSLKYEIWASTDLGNKRLDKAFRESADKGPIYLFFSVNGSGHFAGMAQMLTPVDYSLTSNVWASDKWKGVLKVRWIYIKDVPLNALRHIRLNNTPENKPVTSSRDTQEVPYDAGLEVLRIIATYQSRASLLQDFAWYEAQHRLDRTNEEGASEVVVPPRQAHYARPDRNQNQSSAPNGPTPPPPAPSTAANSSYVPLPSHQQQSQPPQAYPQFIPPTPPFQQHPSHGFSPSPPPQQQQQQQRQPFRSFWRGPNGSPSRQQNGARPGPSHNQYDGPGVAY
ncbi:hypothetical protein JCM5350_005395 [Sporobolomyces pararoseus]